MSPIQQMLLGVGGAAGDPDVNELFRAYKFTGSGYVETVQTLDKPGGGYTIGDGVAVWHSLRGANDPYYFDSTMSAGQLLIPADSSSQFSGWQDSFQGFAANGSNFVLGTNFGWASNGSEYVNWQFRKFKKFFDFGNITKNSSNQTFNHNLDSTPYFLMVKRLNASSEWRGWIGSEGAGKYINMDEDNSMSTSTSSTDMWNNTNPTSTQFTLGSGFPNGTYKYWIWPQYGLHIQCGYYNGNSGDRSINCYDGPGYGDTWVPQFIAIKKIGGGNGNWMWFDTQRGINSSTSPGQNEEEAKLMDTNNRESSDFVRLTTTGFKARSAYSSQTNGSGNKYFYMAVKEV
tara:strand:+ start:376 stop:1407 length:1032 start_codon:yes stop_codon:yes gene_type:complete